MPTVAERNSGYTNLSDLITGQGNKSRADALGRQIPFGAVLDPATTRAVAAGATDPLSGLTNATANTVYVRDPFSKTCGPATRSYTLAGCPDLNQLPANRLDANAIKLLNLYPLPINSSLTSNFISSPKLFEHRNAFDTRFDFNPSQSDQVFYRLSWVDDPIFIPGPFQGAADGGGFSDGAQTARTDQSVGAWTHVFTPSTVNVARVGFNHLHTTRYGPEGGTLGIPAQYGIQGIPQVSENGGLPSHFIQWTFNLGQQFLPAIGRDQPDSSRSPTTFPRSMASPQLQDGDRIPTGEVFDPAAGVFKRHFLLSTLLTPATIVLPIFRVAAGA